MPAILPPLPAGRQTTIASTSPTGWSSPEHPLTARVTVNRFWQQFFGTGLVKTAGDFGAQGEWPSHPELLDWLACEFHERLGRESASCVSSLLPPPIARMAASHLRNFKLDPENRLLARGPRFNVSTPKKSATTLSTSAACCRKDGRPQRKPVPTGRNLGSCRLHRRATQLNSPRTMATRCIAGAYTPFGNARHPPPTLITFDAPSREKYCVRRERS